MNILEYLLKLPEEKEGGYKSHVREVSRNLEASEKQKMQLTLRTIACLEDFFVF